MGRKDNPISLVNGENILVGQLMRQSRQAKGFTLSMMAKRLSYSKGFLSMVENGHKQPTNELINSYESILGLEGGQISHLVKSSQTGSFPLEQLLSFQSHLDLLMQGVDLWNQWREEHLEIDPSLRGVDLVNASLKGVNFNGADLSRANLTGIDLSNADLGSAVLRQAVMNNAILDFANLSRSYLIGAKLSGASLKKANLSEAYLGGVDLSNVDLREANLSNTNLSAANLSKANLRCSDLTGANLTGANLNDVDLSESIATNTIFGNIDLRQVKGLDLVRHIGPSTIGVDTLVRSDADIPDVFLQGIGLDDTFRVYTRSLVKKPIDYYTCFISYSSKDHAFAERLYNDLQESGIRCWFAPNDLKIGDKFRQRIDESLRIYDKLIVILSQYSMQSSWVEREVKVAFDKELSQNKSVLFPIRLDNTFMVTYQGWASEIQRTRHIGDFSLWKEPDAYKKAFRRLLRDLNASSDFVLKRNVGLRAESLVFEWLEKNTPYRLNHNSGNAVPDFWARDKDGSMFGIEVKSYNDSSSLKGSIGRLYQGLNRSSGADKFLVFLVFPDESSAQEASKFFELIESIPPNFSFTLGYIQHNEFCPTTSFRRSEL